MAHANVEFLKRLDEAFNGGDFDAVLAAFSDDCKVHISGRSKMSGDHSGKDVFAGLMMQYMEALGQDPQLETHAIFADDEHGVMLQRIAATKAGKTIEINTVNVFHISGGQITEMWSMDDNPYEADPFYDM
jgi:ketosteroid isomerase-like protein